MRIFVWKRLPKVSYNYHSSGGLVVVARDLDHALELVGDYNATQCASDPEYYSLDDPEDLAYLQSQGLGDRSAPVVIGDAHPEANLGTDDDAQPIVLVMPNAGCC